MKIIVCPVILVIQASVECLVECGRENDVFLKDGQSYTFLFRCMAVTAITVTGSGIHVKAVIIKLS